MHAKANDKGAAKEAGATSVATNPPAALLPCPFCGSEDVSESIGRHANGTAWRYIECGYCASTAEPLIWNRRASTALGASESRGSVPDGYAVLPRETTYEMQDAVRYLLVGLEQPGRTCGSVRKHCERSGMDVSHWPAWTRENDNAHFTKAACAAILWHCMQHAAPTPPAVANGEPTAEHWKTAVYQWALREQQGFMLAPDWVEQRACELARSAAAKGEG